MIFQEPFAAIFGDVVQHVKGGFVYTNDARANLTKRGFRFANIPNGRPDLLINNGERIWHVNAVMNLLDRPEDIRDDGRYTGAIKFRFRDYRRLPVPKKVRGIFNG